MESPEDISNRIGMGFAILNDGNTICIRLRQLLVIEMAACFDHKRNPRGEELIKAVR